MSRKRQEKVFQGEARDSFLRSHPNGFYTKIPDMPRGPQTRFVTEKPFDAIMTFASQFWAVEYKAHTEDTAWPFSELRPNQLVELDRWQQNGGTSVILIQVKTKTQNYAVRMSPQGYRLAKLELGRKSIPLDRMPRYGDIIPRAMVPGFKTVKGKKKACNVPFWDFTTTQPSLFINNK